MWGWAWSHNMMAMIEGDTWVERDASGGLSCYVVNDDGGGRRDGNI